jgi:tetratricopeptide (TPR) repeat protein
MRRRHAVLSSLVLGAGLALCGRASGQVECQVTSEITAAQNTVEGLTAAMLDDPENLTKLQSARAVFQKAVEGCPKATLPLNCLGRTYSFPRQDWALGVAAFEKSLTLVPDQPNVIVRLVEIYLVSGQRAKAVEVQASRVDRKAHPELGARLDRLMASWDSKEGLRLIREGRRGEGVALLDQAIQESLEPSQKESLRRLKDEALLGWEAETYNSALAMAKAQDYRGALATLERLLAVAKEPEVVERAKRMRDRLTAAVGPSPTKP